MAFIFWWRRISFFRSRATSILEALFLSFNEILKTCFFRTRYFLVLCWNFFLIKILTQFLLTLKYVGLKSIGVILLGNRGSLTGHWILKCRNWFFLDLLFCNLLILYIIKILLILSPARLKQDYFEIFALTVVW